MARRVEDESEGAIPPSAGLRVFVVDDQVVTTQLLGAALTRWGHSVEAFQSPRTCLEALLAAEPPPALLITDLMMPDMSGFDLLAAVRSARSGVEVVVVTEHSSLENAVRAMREGAQDYLTKPVNFDALRAVMLRLEQRRALSSAVEQLRLELNKHHAGGTTAQLVGSSPTMQKVKATIQRLSQSKTTSLIRGESGTGKELAARAVHFSGITNRKPFIAINCAGVSSSLLESQLFGHVRGAFTGAIADRDGYFQAAHEGTLFLDEITEMPMEVQAKLLRALQEREITRVGDVRPRPVDVRVIAATNRDPLVAVREGRLREDLYYRLCVVEVALPPLREHKTDIPELIGYMTDRFSREFAIAPPSITPATLQRLAVHDWPGNVRELENLVRRSFALADADGPLELEPAQGGADAKSTAAPPSLPRMTWNDGEMWLLRRTLDASGGDLNEAAKVLDIEKRRLERLLKRHGLS